MLTIVGIALFVIGLLVTVGLHELGHLIPAKKFGVKVPKYFIGFGPTLWSVQRADTEWGIKAIPLGGFVQLAGMLAPAREGVRVTKKDGTGALTLAEEARRQSAAEMEPGEEHKAFWRLSARKKLIVMFGGPFVNLLLSVGLMIGVLCGLGGAVYGSTIASVQECMPSASSEDSQELHNVQESQHAQETEAGAQSEDNGFQPDSARVLAPALCPDNQLTPAAAADIRPGDTILRWGELTPHTWEDIQTAIAAGGTEPVTVELQRAGQKLSVTVTPQIQERPLVRDGFVVTDPHRGKEMTELKPFVGISPRMEIQRQSLGVALAHSGKLAVGTVQVVLSLPVKLWDTAVSLMTGAERGADSVMSVVGVADVAGSIASADIDGYGFAQRTADFLLLMASLNMSLFVFNLIPLLPLDGGHILGAIIEGVRRHTACCFGKKDPGAFDTARLLPLSYVVIAFFVFMTILLVAADIIQPIM